MNIHCYKVKKEGDGADLQQIISVIARKKLQKRNSVVGTNTMRLEELRRTQGYFLLEFGLLRDGHGPGKGRKTQATTGIKLQNNDRFSEMTAALFWPEKETIIVQYNHYGVRGGSISGYFNDFDKSDGFSFAPVIDPEIEAKLRRMKHVKSITCKVATTGLVTDHMRDEGWPVATAMSAKQDYGFDNLAITMSFQQGSKVDAGVCTKMLKKLNINIGDDKYTKLIVSGKESLDFSTKVLDLKKQRLCIATKIELDEHRRFPLEKRWDALKQAAQQWSELL